MNKYGRQLFIIREWGQKLGFNIEMWKCLQEYYGLENTDLLVLPNDADAVDQIKKSILEVKPAKIFMDSRIFIVDSKIFPLTKHLSQVSELNRVLKKNQIIPICVVTDAQAPGYCLVAELLVHGIGFIVPIGSEFKYRSLNKGRKIGALFNPVSLETGAYIMSRAVAKSKDLYLGGSLYEPRKSFILETTKELIGTGILLEISPKKSNTYNEYLLELAQNKIVLNTNFIAESKKVHMVGRNIETFHSGSLLITQDTPLLTKYFTRGEHYVHADSPHEVGKLVKYYLKHEQEAKGISLEGQKRAMDYARGKYFMKSIEEKTNSVHGGVAIEI